MKVTKSSHHLFHDQASVRGMGLFLVWRHRLTCIVVSFCKHVCKEVCDVKPETDPYPLVAWFCNRWWPAFVIFAPPKKSRFDSRWAEGQINFWEWIILLFLISRILNESYLKQQFWLITKLQVTHFELQLEFAVVCTLIIFPIVSSVLKSEKL